MPTARLTAKGQITIAKSVRDRLNLHAGDKIDIVVEDDKRVVTRPATIDVRELRGILHRPGMRAISLEEMDRVIRERARDGS